LKRKGPLTYWRISRHAGQQLHILQCFVHAAAIDGHRYYNPPLAIPSLRYGSAVQKHDVSERLPFQEPVMCAESGTTPLPAIRNALLPQKPLQPHRIHKKPAKGSPQDDSGMLH
jgi:hypothetical protein